MDIKQEITNRAKSIDELLEKYLPDEDDYQKTIFSAMNYSVRAGGKRLRPMLIEATYQMFGGSGDVIEPFMAAIEFIHTYSLVHDDLPAMDNDDYRRGKPTTHKEYGEAMGILAGDALLNYAYETATLAFYKMATAVTNKNNAELNIPADAYIEETVNAYERVLIALRILAKKAGVFGMVGGQVVDVESEKNQIEITRDKLDFIYKLKTGALIEASMMIGAILGGATDKELKIVEKSARNLGLAFQIQDDILDVTSTFEVLGKPIGSDDKNNKATYVAFEGLEKAKEDVERFSNEACELIASLEKDDEFLQALFKYLIKRDR